MKKITFSVTIIFFGLLLFSCKKDNKVNQEPISINGTVSDVDGNNYQTIIIGNQTWMSENLKVAHYRDGSPIPIYNNDTAWKNTTSGACCSYNNDTLNFAIYGRLYNWYAVNDPREIAPIGWHVPTENDWKILSAFLGDSTIAGGKMKEVGTTHWLSPNYGATNTSGFSALPAGLRLDSLGIVKDKCLGEITWFWSSTSTSTYQADFRLLSYNGPMLLNDYICLKRFGFSIRCIKN